MQRPVGRKSLLAERIADYPSYMMLSSDAASKVLSSLKSVFTTSLSSLKLIGSTIKLNLDVISNSFKGDQAAIDNSFKEFNAKRDKIQKDIHDDLKYFRSAVGDSPLEKGIVSSVAFAANPILGLSMLGIGSGGAGSVLGSNEPVGSAKPEGGRKPEKEGGGTRISDRLKAAMIFFGYRGDDKLSEAAALPQTKTNAPAPKMSKEQQAAVERLKQKSKEFFDTQVFKANEIMQSLAPQLEAVRSILRAEDYTQLSAATKLPAIKGMGLKFDQLAGLEKTIVDSLTKKQAEDPEGFSKEVATIRKKFPDLQASNDVELLKKASFAAVKGPAQQGLLKQVDERTRAIMSSMNLPIDAETRKMLVMTPEGKSYLDTMDALLSKLQGFSQQVNK
jgi:hypothetical protein